MMQVLHTLEVSAKAGGGLEYFLDGKSITEEEYKATQKDWVLADIADNEKRHEELLRQLESLS